jgi:LytS/YehU family sensor histidine kinase
MNINWRDLIRRCMLVLAFCCVTAALTVATWPIDYLVQLAYALSIGTLTWVVIEVGRLVLRRPTDPGGWPRGARNVLLVIAGIGLGFYLGGWLGNALLGIGTVAVPHDKRVSVIVSVIVGVGATYFFHTRGSRAELSAKINAAERDAAEARLKLLATQLEPHMLFNTLANLRVLIGSDPPRAIIMLDRLDSFLRVTLVGSMARTHPLGTEFDHLADYLTLMQVRMGPRLRYVLDLPDDLHDLPVPPLLLQPLVENSIRHGLEPKVAGGQITVRARAEGRRLIIQVHDTGVGLDEDFTVANNTPGAGHSTGFGLPQVRNRLTSFYGGNAALILVATPDSGTCVTLTLPLESP